MFSKWNHFLEEPWRGRKEALKEALQEGGVLYIKGVVQHRVPPKWTQVYFSYSSPKSIFPNLTFRQES